jgi:hypothetical protein
MTRELGPEVSGARRMHIEQDEIPTVTGLLRPKRPRPPR